MNNMNLTQQEVETLKQILEVERIDENTSNSYNTIVNNIIKKLEDYENEI